MTCPQEKRTSYNLEALEASHKKIMFYKTMLDGVLLILDRP